MPVTRSQGQSSQMRRGFRGRNQGRLDPLSRPSTPASQAGPSRHPASALHQAADAPAYPAESLDPHISVERLHIVPLENDAYWAIQLNPVSVRIYSPSGGTGRVICSCVEFQKTQTVCAHINWLWTGLNSVIRDIPVSATSLPPSEVIPRLSLLYPSIMTYGGSLREELNALRGRGAETPSPAEVVSPNEFDDLCDILSVFEPSLLPEDFHRRFVDHDPQATKLEDCLQPHSLNLTLFRMGMLDTSVFDALRATVPRDYCRNVYYSKQRLRIRETLERFDRGEVQEGADRRSLVVVQCGDKLSELVDQVYTYHHERESLAQIPSSEAARLLIELVDEVCQRNQDVRKGPPPHSWDPKFNLFTYLIGAPPGKASEATGAEGAFVIDKLRDFSDADWKPMSATLDRIKTYIELNHGKRERAASLYAAKIANML